MGIAAINGLFIPEVVYAAQATSRVANLLDAAGEQFASVVQAPTTGSIRKIGIPIGTVTTATDTQVRIETVDLATGFPTGTLWAANTEVTLPAASIVTNTWVLTAALTADAVVTQGDIFAIVMAPSGTPSYNVYAPYVTQQTQGFPYNAHFTASWAALVTNMGFGLEYSDGTYAYIPGSYPFSSFTAQTYNNASATDERALKFRFPFAFSMKGIWVHMDLDGDFDVVLYDSDGTTVRRTLAVDKELRSGTASRSPFFFAFSASYTGLANTFYRVSIRPSTTTDLTLNLMLFSTSAILNQLSGGSDISYSSRVDAGAWADQPLWRNVMGIWLDGVAIEGSGQRGGGQYTPVLLS